MRENSSVSREQVQGWVTDGVQSLLKSAAAMSGTFALGVVGSLVGFFMMLFLLFFLLRDGRMMLARLPRLIPMEPDRRKELLAYLANVTLAVVFGSVATALIQGALAGVGFAIVGLPSPVVFAVLATIAAFLPAGSAIVLVPAVLYLMIVGRWGAAIFLAVWSAAVGVADNFLRPFLTSQRAEVSTLAVFVGAIGGASAFGILGLVIGPVLLGFVVALVQFAEESRWLRLPAGGADRAGYNAPPMDLSPLLDPLNEAQREAVTAPLGPVLVLAGAGSGKTRVLTYRIAWLIQAQDVSPHSILAVTFTNKAAGEMRGRIETLLGIPGSSLWIGTFHGLAHRLLRLHWREAGLVQGFQILDAEDQQRLIKKLIKARDLDESRWVPREVQWFINSNKDEGRRPKRLKDNDDPTRRQFIQLYVDYEEACARNGVVDFAELLLRAYELWRDNTGLLAHYRRRFRHVLVDEFQDTNAIQYAWLKLLATNSPADGTVTIPFRCWGRRPVHISVERRTRGEPPPVPPRLPRHATVPARAELPLDRLDSRGGQRPDLQQHRPARQEPLDQRRARRPDSPVRRLQRARRGGIRRPPDP